MHKDIFTLEDCIEFNLPRQFTASPDTQIEKYVENHHKMHRLYAANVCVEYPPSFHLLLSDRKNKDGNLVYLEGDYVSEPLVVEDGIWALRRISNWCIGRYDWEYTAVFNCPESMNIVPHIVKNGNPARKVPTFTAWVKRKRKLDKVQIYGTTILR